MIEIKPMQMQSKAIVVNNWSCTALSFAMAYGIGVLDLIKWIGHDGSRVVDPFVAEPVGRQGFHVQECVMYGLCVGMTATPFQIMPASMVNGTVVNLGSDARLGFADELISRERGVLIGNGDRCQHAMAFERGRIFDPGGFIRPFHSVMDLVENFQYHPTEVWVVK